jgi:hypothetical protein
MRRRSDVERDSRVGELEMLVMRYVRRIWGRERVERGGGACAGDGAVEEVRLRGVVIGIAMSLELVEWRSRFRE